MSSKNATVARPGNGSIFVDSLLSLEKYVRARGYEGIDPYDALASPLVRSLPGNLPKLAMTQFFVYSPINMRELFKTKPGKNPKAIALFLSSYCDMYRVGLIPKESLTTIARTLSDELIASHIRGYHGYCWGINFDLQDGKTIIHPDMPSIIPTSFAANAFLDFFEITRNQEYLRMALSCCDFIVNDLNMLDTNEGICFSYRPNDNKAVHNANLLGAAILSRASFHGGKSELLDLSRKAVDFTVKYQESDGSWAYGIDPNTGHKRFQIDYHQGFIINSLLDFIQYSNLTDPKYENALRRGVSFYRREQFDDLGRSMWRLPWRWPIEIHHQAQGISTFARLWHIDQGCLPFASKIAEWTIENMQDRAGYFYHQKYPLGANKISYMRWSQSWMMLSLAQLLRCTKEHDGKSPGAV